MITYNGRNGRTYSLGSKIGSGGEGTVYEVIGSNDLVAKVYPSPATSTQREKITTMLNMNFDPYLLDEEGNKVLTVAWPHDLLLDYSGTMCGYVMPKVHTSHHIFEAARERERLQLYPRYNKMTPYTIARNLATAVKIMHAHDVVIGDFNQNNIMVNEHGYVTLIDCDSFTITNRNTGKVYKTTVGVAEMLPPELQGRDLSRPSSKFTEQSDNFQLAIHIFILLMNNTHPFTGEVMNHSQNSSCANPITTNIAQGMCPAVKGGICPSCCPPFNTLYSPLQRKFIDVFRYDANDAVKSATIHKRPTANQWQTVLDMAMRNMKNGS